MKTAIIHRDRGRITMTAGPRNRRVSVRVSPVGRVNVRVPSTRRGAKQGAGRYFKTFDAAIDAYRSASIKAILLRAKGELLDYQLAVLSVQRTAAGLHDPAEGYRALGAATAAARLQSDQLKKPAREVKRARMARRVLKAIKERPWPQGPEVGS
jgi:hypothetical protein